METDMSQYWTVLISLAAGADLYRLFRAIHNWKTARLVKGVMLLLELMRGQVLQVL